MAPTQGEDVGVAWPRHVVLLDGLVERGLAEEQEAQANPHGQQPGHGGTEPAAGETEVENGTEGCVMTHLAHTNPQTFQRSVGRAEM